MLPKPKKLFVAMLLLSIATASYPFKAVNRIDELKIPFCINQIGAQCLVCGYDDEKKVFTAPNALQTACLPSVNGCLEYKDLKGEVCNVDAGHYCGCGFSVNALRTECVPTPPGLQNCLVLSRSGTQCDECVSPGKELYGGGYGDYGINSDKTKCLDNTILNKPNCQIYKVGDTDCAKCRIGFAFNAAGVCVKLASSLEDNCQLANELGICTKCQINSKFDTSTQRCKLNTIYNSNCVAYLKLPNGLNDETTCIQCKPGYLISKTGCKPLPTGNRAFDLEQVLTDINNPGINSNLLVFGRWCLAFVTGWDGKRICSIPQASVTNYQKGIISSKITTLSSTFGSDVIDSYCRSDQADATDFSCPSAADCYNAVGDDALVYDENTKTCRTIISVMTNYDQCSQAVQYCKVAESLGWCKECYPGYTAQEGMCVKVPDNLWGCKVVNEDGKTCKTCQTRLVTVNNSQSMTTSYYRLNKLTGLCVALTPIEGCTAYDETTLLCTTCQDGYEQKNGICSWIGPVETPIGQYGCKTFADNKCTEALPGFSCDSLGYQCSPIDYSHNCFRFSSTGDCELCKAPEFFAVYDDVTKKYSQCIKNTSVQFDDYGCARRSSSCGDCDLCQSGYSQVTLTGGTTTGCYFSAADGATPPIAGCVKHTSKDACEVCGPGYIQTADSKCFDLYGRRTPSINEGRLNAGGVELSNLTPEPCQEASTLTACTSCEAPAGADVGLRKYAAGLFNDSKARAFCVYNVENIGSVTGSAGTLNVVERKNCVSYQQETNAGALLNQCETAANGYTLLNGIPTNATNSDGTEFGFAANTCKSGSITKNGNNWECSLCNTDYLLASDKTCVAISTANQYGARFGCKQAAYSGTDIICSKCRAGFKLLVDTSSSNKNLNNQCHEIYIADESDCLPSRFTCANQDITITFDNANLIGGISAVKRTVSSCTGSGYTLANSQCTATINLVPNCSQFNEKSGACQSCSTGFILIDITDSSDSQNIGISSYRSDLLNLRCVKEVPNCQSYNEKGQCTACGTDPLTGKNFYLDDQGSGNVCLDEATQYSTGCYQYDSPTTCVQCKPGRGVPTDGCKLNIICAGTHGTFPEVCYSCPTNYALNYKYECIPNLYGRLDDCELAYNSTSCLNCDNGQYLYSIEDNEEASDIGLCRNTPIISGCAHSSADGTKCYRCVTGYAWIDGACFYNADQYPSLRNCAEFQYDTDKKQLYCSECIYGYAIDGNYTTCISNNHNCTDVSGGNDCSKITLLQPFSQTFECDEYRSSSLLVSFSMILALILSIIL